MVLCNIDLSIYIYKYGTKIMKLNISQTNEFVMDYNASNKDIAALHILNCGCFPHIFNRAAQKIFTITTKD